MDNANIAIDDDSSSGDESLSSSGLPSSLQEGEIWVEYHPFSGKKSEVLRPGDLEKSPVALPSAPQDPRMPAWYPFHSRADFEQAELFIRFGCTDSYMDNQLKLIKSGSISGHEITLRSAKEVHETLARVPAIEQLPRV